MTLNPKTLISIKKGFDTFRSNHPKFISFIGNVGSAQVKEGSILELKIVNPDGEEFVTNLKANQDDIEFLKMIRPEIKFSSVEELKAQIEKDIEYVKKDGLK